MQEVGN